MGGFLWMEYARAGGSANQFARVQYLPSRFAVQYAEIANVSSIGTNIRIARIGKGGKARPTISTFLRPKETRKMRLSRLLDRYTEGVANISSDIPHSIIINSIVKHYRGDKKLLSMKAQTIKETFGDTMYGIYRPGKRNKTILKLTNMGTSTVEGSITCYVQSQAADVARYSLKPGELYHLPLAKCFRRAAEGVLEVNASTPGAIVADTLTYRKREDIHLPRRLR
jgi:hypothetical protein